jgi:hypothetical protein
MIAEAEVEREGRRIFRKLMRGGAWLAPLDAEFYTVSAAGRLIRPKVANALVMEFVKRDWLRARDEATFALSEAGEGWFIRTQSVAEPFAAQHQLRAMRTVQTDEGERSVCVNDGESPLGWLKSRGIVDAVQFDAGERLRRDFTIAQMTPRLGVDWSAPVVLGSRGAKSDMALPEIVMAAKQRFNRALKDVGPGLSDLLFDVCCHLIGLEAAERTKGWPQRSAKVVLQIALDRLAEHYGMRGSVARGQVRSWRGEDA